MGKSKITFRQKQIILILIDNNNTKKTIKDIATQLNVSSRTIIRELAFVERFLYEKGINFVKKSGVGIFIDDNYEKINKLKDCLNECNLTDKISQNDRVLYIIENLLDNHFKSQFFLDKLKIAYSTFIKDLDLIKEIINKFNLDLIIKKGTGIYIKGNEDKLRELRTHLFYEKFSNKNLTFLFKTLSPNLYNYTLNFLDINELPYIKSDIMHVFETFNIRVSDKVYISLIVHVSLTINRIKNKFYCEYPENIIDSFRGRIEFEISSILMSKLGNRFGILIEDGDVCYVSMHLYSHNICRNSIPHIEDFNFDKLDKIKLAGDIISEVQKHLGVSLIDSRELVKNLSIHLSSAISRLAMKMIIRNPFLDLMKNDYKDIFNATKIACKVLENIVLNDIPDSEVAYIAMHIATAYESKLRSKFKYKVLIYCEGEKRVCLFLYNKIIQEFPNIIVIRIISSFDDLEKFYNESIDFVICTSKIKCDYNHVKVNVNLTLNDIFIINSKIKELFIFKSKLLHRDTREHKSVDFDSINFMGDMIKLIEKQFCLKKVSVSDGIENTIREVVNNIDTKFKDEIFFEILKKEHIVSSYMKDYKIILMHTISNFSENMFIGSCVLDNEINIYDGNLNLIFYFIIPERLNKKVLREIIGELTSNLVKDSIFVDILRNGDIYKVKKYINGILSKFYVQELKEVIKKFEN